MSPSETWAFALTFFVFAVAPGPGVFITVSRALASGAPHGAIVALGIVTGDLIYLLVAVYGLAAMAQALGGFFSLIQYGGGAYLLWLGLRIWSAQPPDTRVLQGVCEPSWKDNYLSGLLVTLGNPKAILFYLGLLPGFVELDNLSRGDVLRLACIIGPILGSVMVAYACTAGQVRRLLAGPKAGRMINRVAGGIMLAAGVALLKTGSG
ncbi:MAG TPA: LysE family translocator [Gammaproteobacteria bacterium]|nr:LysE family translocator [Gammaproteobacteria bacterium]